MSANVELECMALIDTIFDGELDQDIFAAALWFWAKGDLTRQNVIDGLGLAASDEAQLDLLATAYTNRSAEDKQTFLSDIEAAVRLARTGLITKSKFQSLLGL